MRHPRRKDTPPRGTGVTAAGPGSPVIYGTRPCTATTTASRPSRHSWPAQPPQLAAAATASRPSPPRAATPPQALANPSRHSRCPPFRTASAVRAAEPQRCDIVVVRCTTMSVLVVVLAGPGAPARRCPCVLRCPCEPGCGTGSPPVRLGRTATPRPLHPPASPEQRIRTSPRPPATTSGTRPSPSAGRPGRAGRPG